MDRSNGRVRIRNAMNLRVRAAAFFCIWIFSSISSWSPASVVSAANDDYYGAGDDDWYNNGNNNNYNNNNNANGGGDDDAAAAQGDDANGDDANGDGGGDDDANDDAQADEANADDGAANDANVDDDLFHWNSNVGFEGVSIMPVSCVNYNNGHMIKFELFDTENSYQCHFAQIGTFVVSIAHYMRAYFNYEALVKGNEFELPGDAGFLNCVQLQQVTAEGTKLYGKIGCMERETFTSTKLALHVYTDNQCSRPLDDGQSNRRHSSKGYDIDGYLFSTKVSFKPPFYSCATCSPTEISDSFNKKSGVWYDDDYFSSMGKNNGGNNKNNGGGDQQKDGDDYYQDDVVDDAYLAANDDVYRNDDGGRLLRQDTSLALQAAPGELEAFHEEFWAKHTQQRQLYGNNYDIGDWNMCQRAYKYGIWCDDDCKALDAFRTDRWSGADIILLTIMILFMAAMMILIVAKHMKAVEKMGLYSDKAPMPGLPPIAMASIFVGVMTIVFVLAQLKFVNETLVFAIVTCILLFIYMLKLTLFDSQRPVLLAAPRHEVFDNPLDDRLFD